MEGQPMKETSANPGFIGWHRPGQRSPWVAIVEADTEDAAFQQLLDAVRGGDKAVLPRGVDPNDTTPKMRLAGGKRYFGRRG
jgi:hypothetical protein